MVNMNELIFEEYDRLNYNYHVCLLGFKAICEYCKDKAIPTDDIMIIGNIIEKVFDELKDAPKEVKNND